MRLSHWSERPIAQVGSRDPARSRWAGKPAGLWLSVDGEDDWAAWCEAEQFVDLSRHIRYEVVLALDANLLLLDTAEAVQAFTREHGRTARWSERGTVDGIDWARVAAAYQGIIIAPYQWSLRLELETFWYYGWDCASGVIWDAAAVKELKPWRLA